MKTPPLRKVLKKVPRKVLKSKQCFHYGHSIDINEEKKEESKPAATGSNLTLEEIQKRKDFTEQKFDYYKKKGAVKYWSKRPPRQKIDLDLL
jgi:hypothetical protein